MNTGPMRTLLSPSPVHGALGAIGTLSAFGALALAPPAALAQETAAVGELPTVIVTAERREENIQDVPVSVSTLSGEGLDVIESGGGDLQALAARVPSLNVESSFGRAFPRFYIRGFGNADYHLEASQPISLIYDDVVQENPILKGFPVFDLADVEVLRGPQGTLFGRNTPAGVVKFDSAKPNFTDEGYASVSYATYNTVNVETALNLPLSQTWAVRFSGLWEHRDPWISDAYSGNRDQYGGYEDAAGRLQLLFKPSDGFEALFNVHDHDLQGSAILFRANIFTPGTNDLLPTFRPDTVYTDGRNLQWLENFGANARLTWKFDGFNVYSISGYETVHVYSRGDIDGGFGASYAPPYGPGFIPFADETADGLPSHEQLSQEVRVESTGPGPLSWQAGVYYFYEGITVDSFAYDTLGGSNPPNFNQPAGIQEELEVSKQDNHAYALFGSTDYTFAPPFDVRAGLRYTSDKKDFATLSYAATDGTSLSGPLSASTDAANFSWDVSPTYKLAQGENLYARVATGFRAPSIQPASAFGPQSVVKSETVTSYEVGFKSELLDKRLRLDFDLFDYEVKNQQLAAVGGAGNATILVNAAKTAGHGAEFDLQAEPAPHLLTTLSGSYNFTAIQDPSLEVAPCGGGCTVLNYIDPKTGNAVIDGNPLPQAPRWIGDLTLRYGVPTANGGEFFAYTDWSYRSEVDFFLYRSTEFTGKALLLGGLRLGYDWDDAKYELAAYTRNITNKVVATGGIDFNNLTGYINDPRIVGVQLRAKF
jgi:iron complex outermembrane receptor protein